MTTIKLGTNIAALRAQRQLGAAADKLGTVFQRLSSGQRINRASDDAAGLAIADSLNASSRVFAQGVRNINDGISLLSIYEQGLNQLTNIVIRQQELAEQSANGVYSYEQRKVLHTEAMALKDEYNRLVESVSFNQQKLMETPSQSLRIQAGFGIDGSINMVLGGELERTVGTGNFNGTSVSGGEAYGVDVADFDNDGYLDAVFSEAFGNQVRVLKGDGQGGLSIHSNTGVGNDPRSVRAADFNGDGNADIAVSDSGDGTIRILLGDGDGTFQAPSSFAANTPTELLVDDFNGDGIVDLVSSSSGNNTISVFHGNGDGTFQTAVTTALSSTPEFMAKGDLNNDGIADLVVSSETSDTISLFVGNGSGSFTNTQSFSSGSASTGGVAIADLNGDGKAEVIFTAGTVTTTVSMAVGNGNGTVGAAQDVITGIANSPGRLETADFNGDGYQDLTIVRQGSGGVFTTLGNGDGSFNAVESQLSPNSPHEVGIADFNADGALDFVVAGQSGSGGAINMAVTSTNTKQESFSLYTRADSLAAMSTLETALERISLETGLIGSTQSRLSVAVKVLSVARENYIDAGSQIHDADIAEESAHLTRLSILQNAATSALAQANQLPTLAVQLLS